MKTPSSVNPNYGMLWIGSPYVADRSYAKDVNYRVKASAPYAAKDLVYLDGYGGQRVLRIAFGAAGDRPHRPGPAD
jgi:hypothetical protein